MRKKKPRGPSGYDNAIHGRKDYDEPICDDEPDDEVTARTRVLDAIGAAPPAMKFDYLRRLRPLREEAEATFGVTRTNPRSKTASTADVKPTIWHRVDEVYSPDKGDDRCVVVSQNESNVLEAFAEKKVAMTRSELERRSGVSNAPQVMKQLATKYNGQFAAAIRRPGVKGKGGYFARVRSLPTPAE